MLRHPMKEAGENPIVRLDLSPNAAWEREALGWINDGELERRRRFRHAQSCRQFTFCRSAPLRSSIESLPQVGGSNDDLSIASTRYGKPVAAVAGTPAQSASNVSHSSQNGLKAGASKARIGVDVEERSLDRKLEGYADLLFAPNEQGELERANGSTRSNCLTAYGPSRRHWSKQSVTVCRWTPRNSNFPVLIPGDCGAEFSFPETSSIRWRVQNTGNEHFAAAFARELD